MANYEGVMRSNYFQVKDPEAFEDFIEKVFVGLDHKVVEGKTYYMVYSDTGDGMPSSMDLEGGEDPVEIDFPEMVSTHLLEGEIAVFEEAGHEKVRYVSAYAIAINHKGEVLDVHLSDIYKKIEKEWGIETNQATY